MTYISRRSLIKAFSWAAASAITPAFSATTNNSSAGQLIKKTIPSTGEKLPSVGMGTWQTFNVGSDEKLRDARTQVLHSFFEMGGELVDSSPMYGSSQSVVGHALEKLQYPTQLFSADKIWTSNGDETLQQANEISEKWSIPKFNLLQVHNLVSWESHLENLFEMKRNAKLEYVGITTSHGRRHSELEQIMKTQPLDFVQFTYNLNVRVAEQRLLPLAMEKKIAVIINRPYQGGHLVKHLKRTNAPLPPWAKDYQCYNWPQLLLKFITSHPAVTCVIPATRRVPHMRENMGAMSGPLLDSKIKSKLISYVASL